MVKHVKLVVGLLMLALLFGCAGTGSVGIPESPSEKLIYSSSPERPAWTMEEPEAVDGVLSFTGTSGRYATEKGAREDARRNAISAVVKWMGTLAKDKFERASVSFGLESSVVDATASAREFEKQLATNMASQVKVKSWYMEKWQTATGIGYQYFALAKVPEHASDEAFQKMAADQARKAEQKAKQEADAIAKDQAQKAADFWKQMKDQGLSE